MDINPRHLVTAGLLGDEFIQCPLANSVEFPAVLEAIIRQHEVDTWLPLLPEEIILACKLRQDSIVGEKCKLILPGGDTAVVCSDKWMLAVALRQRDIPTPGTALASAPIDKDLLFLKPRIATGAKGARTVARSQVARFVSDVPDSWIVQEICTGPEVTIDAFHNPVSGELISTARERLEVKLGVSTKARLFRDPALHQLTERLVKTLKLDGSFCYQVMKLHGEWAVTDVNPRPGGASAMCSAVGQDFFAATFAYHWGEDCARFFRKLDRERFVTRQYAEFLMA